MAFVYPRTIRFQDTDAAGVVYFANVLTICHEAYEASLASAGVDLKAFFRGVEIAMPIVQAEVDFLQPLFCGDRVQVLLTVRSHQPTEFTLNYRIVPTLEPATPLGLAQTRHVCIQPQTRSRCPHPDFIQFWLHQLLNAAAQP